MKRIISLVLSLAMVLSALCSVSFQALAYTSGDYTYTLSGDEATITGYSGNRTIVTVPDELDGHPVTAIGRAAFFMHGEIVSLTISDGIKTIGDMAFHDCNAIDELNLGKDVETIGMNAFYHLFFLQELHLPASVSSIGTNAFSGSERLKTITVDSANTHFTAVDNVLYNKDMTELIRYASKKTDTAYTVPDGVTVIDNGAFFYAATLEEITLPASLTLINEAAFDSVTGLQTVRYDDYEETWNSRVTIKNDEGGNDVLFKDSVTYIFKQPHVHTPGEAVVENEVPATCTTDGSYDEVVYCTECGEELSRETKTTDKLDHTAGEVVIENEVPATCTAGGSYDEVIYCTVCNEELSRETKTIDKLDHTAGEPIIENAEPATCTAGGSYDEVIYCTVCNEELSRETKTTEKLGHTPGDVVIENEVAATCTAGGSYDEVIYCTVCNEELSRETKTTEKLGHTPGEVVIENEVAATCTTDGSYDEVIYCTVCNEELSRET